jgi:murein DD-endopeptidase MepM/ murein hydrolase activator NlpD
VPELSGYRDVGRPLEQCVLRCDRYMRLVVGGTYGYTRGAHKQFHGGIDLYAEPGTKARALFKGTTEWATDFDKGWGKAVLLRLEFQEGVRWALYAHLRKIFVKKGSKVEKGTLIGETGVTGNGDSHYPHLHLEIWTNRKAGLKGTQAKYRLDPLLVLGPLPMQPFAEEQIELGQRYDRTA